MNRPWKTWLIFALCTFVLLAVIGWISRTVWRLTRAQGQAQAQAEIEEKVRLALWRMDSLLAPLIAQENGRPYFAYQAFYPAESAAGYAPQNSGAAGPLVPSPLLTQISTNILLHFQRDASGRLSSPQVPEGRQRDLAEARFTTRPQIEAAAARLRQLQELLNQTASPELALSARQAAGALAASNPVPTLRNNDALLALAPPPLPRNNYGASLVSRSQVNARSLGRGADPVWLDQTGRNTVELEARSQSMQQAIDVNIFNGIANAPLAERAQWLEEVLKPVWLNETLVLVRRVRVQGQEYLQGCWLDWPGTRRWLGGEIKDLLPQAQLEPLPNNREDPQARMLATIPVRLVPGPAPAAPASAMAPMLLALGLAWLCLLLAGIAVALLLQGTLALSERRAAFVSAVTHELRTPLTTFKMYSEMLALDMVPSETKRRDYLSRLCAEADRLQHLVENVLAYARLERGSARQRAERITVRDLLARVQPRLDQRAEQSGLTIQPAGELPVLETVLQVDVSAVEQILFNLVDNAAKYAAPFATEKIIHLEAVLENSSWAVIRVRDHGPGLSADARQRLFQPFSKSAHEAAVSAPGVGLGLALCRRLSRSLGGDLRLNSRSGPGACFELLLPVAAAPAR